MNIIEAMQIIQAFLRPLFLDEAYSEPQAAKAIDDLLAAYNALEPDWTQAPADMNCFAIDGNGGAYWYDTQPTIDMLWGEWDSRGEIVEEAGTYVLPFGIDWRLCKWAKPEAQ